MEFEQFSRKFLHDSTTPFEFVPGKVTEYACQCLPKARHDYACGGAEDDYFKTGTLSFFLENEANNDLN